MDLNQYMGMFLDESREHLQSLNSCLLELENDPSNLSVLDEIFRSAHTIKGMSATMGFTAIAELTHDMENILDLLRKEQIKASAEIIDTLFQCVDTLEQIVEGIASDTEINIDTKSLISKLNLLASGKGIAPVQKINESVHSHQEDPVTSAQSQSTILLNDTENVVLAEAEKQGMNGYSIHIVLSKGCLLKSARAYMVVSALEDLGDIIKCEPSVEQLEKENFDQSFDVVLVSDAEPNKIQQRLLSISEIELVEVVNCESHEFDIKEAKATKPTEKKIDVPAITSRTSEGKQAQQTKSSETKHVVSQTVRVDIEKLDSLLNLVGELVINKTRLEQIGLTHKLQDLVETIEMMDRITTDLQAVVMKVRMVPVGQVFNRFPRMVRDLSHELGKEINLIIQGEDTELDRTVID